MKKITNTSLQGIFLTFNSNEGLKDFYLRPKKVLVVPNSYSSKIVDNLVRRRLLRVEFIEDQILEEKSLDALSKKSKYK